MRLSDWRLERVAGMGAALSLGVAAWTAAVLTWRYRPGSGPETQLSASARWSRQLVDWHGLSISIAVVALLLWCGLMLSNRGWRSRHAAIAVCSTLGALVLLGGSTVAWNRVRWDQLALWAVTVGSNTSGLWYAAFSDDVRFAFVGSSGELAQSEIAPWVVVYLAAPFAALGLFGIGWLTTRPKRAPRRSVITIGA